MENIIERRGRKKEMEDEVGGVGWQKKLGRTEKIDDGWKNWIWKSGKKIKFVYEK